MSGVVQLMMRHILDWAGLAAQLTLKFRMLPRLGSATNTTVSPSTPQKSLMARPA